MVCLSYRSEFEVIRNFCLPQVELVIRKRLRAGSIDIVGNAVKVSGIFECNGVDETIGDVNGVAAGGGSLELLWLQPAAVNVGKIKAIKRGELADGKCVKRALESVAGDAIQAGSARRGCEAGGVSDAVRAICRCAGPISGIVSVVDSAASGVNGFSHVAGEIEVVGRCLGDVRRRAVHDARCRAFLERRAQVIAKSERALAAYTAALKELAEAESLRKLQETQLQVMQQAIRAGADNRLSLDNVEIQSWLLARAQLDALARAQRALGELEDAVQRPLDPGGMFSITPESPAVIGPPKDLKR
jgi:hypothetical protein